MITDLLKEEIKKEQPGEYCPDHFRSLGYEASRNSAAPLIRADGTAALFTLPTPFIYKNDLIVGSIRPYFATLSEDDRKRISYYSEKYPERDFAKNGDHFAPDYFTAVKIGIPGLIGRIAESERDHENGDDALVFLSSMKKTLLALTEKLRAYVSAALSEFVTAGTRR